MKTYSIKLRTGFDMVQLTTALGPLGDVLAIVQDDEARALLSFGPHDLKKRLPNRAFTHMHTPEAQAKAVASRQKIYDAHMAKVVAVLKPIVVANPYTTMDKIVDLMNKTDTRTFQGKPWTAKSLQRRLDAVLDELTRPALPAREALDEENETDVQANVAGS